MENDPQDAARSALRSWRRRSDSVASDRDPLVRNALAAGLTKEDVHIITGLGRTTIDRITKTAQREGQAVSYKIFYTSGDPYISGDRDHQFAPRAAAEIVKDSPWAAIDSDGDIIIGSYRTRASWNGGKPVEGYKLAQQLGLWAEEGQGR